MGRGVYLGHRCSFEVVEVDRRDKHSPPGQQSQNWLSLDGGRPEGLHVGFMYLPANDDKGLLEELDGLSEDLGTLSRGGEILQRILIFGDWNYQSSELSGEPDHRNNGSPSNSDGDSYFLTSHSQ